MRPFLLVCLTIVLAHTMLGCAMTPPRFPEDWLGSWAGEVTPYSANGANDRFGMRLDITRTDDPSCFDWTITYSGSAGTQVRAYSLVVRDAAAGRFAIDERNGIVLEQQLLGDALYSWFDVAGTRLCVRERLVRTSGDEHIEVEIASARDRDATATGPSGEVSCRPLVSVQRARLERVQQAR
jgi:hypothetical protein